MYKTCYYVESTLQFLQFSLSSHTRSFQSLVTPVNPFFHLGTPPFRPHADGLK